jgi:hypothetical protein
MGPVKRSIDKINSWEFIAIAVTEPGYLSVPAWGLSNKLL